jgi:hypothetical protein
MNGLIGKGAFLAGISQKFGIRMKKFYANPVPTEISFDLEFTHFYDAFSEVVYPVLLLINMSLGRLTTHEKVLADIKKMQDKANAAKTATAEFIPGMSSIDKFLGISDDRTKPSTPTPEQNQTDTAALSKKAVDLLGFISAPELTSIKFGRVYTLTNCYISHVSVKFSNVLDYNGFPTSAVVSIVATPEEYPVADTVNNWFLDSIGGLPTPFAQRGGNQPPTVFPNTQVSQSVKSAQPTQDSSIDRFANLGFGD